MFGQAVRAAGDGDRQMCEHSAGMIGVPGDPAGIHCGRPTGLGGVPARLTKFLPSGITLTRRTERLRCTFKELSSMQVTAVVVTVILPGRRAFCADARTSGSVVGRIPRLRPVDLGNYTMINCRRHTERARLGQESSMRTIDSLKLKA
jgi:hypothetical protein